MQPGVIPGAVLELHAARACGGKWRGTNAYPQVATWRDTSGYGNDGTLANIAYTTASGWAGNGTEADPYRLVHDGVNDRVVLPDTGVAEDKTFTLELWIREASPPTWNAYAISESQDSSSTASLACLGVLANSGVARFFFADDTGANASINGTTNVCDDLVHQVLSTCDGSTMRIYVDGAAQGTPVSAPAGTVAMTNAFLGCFKRGSSPSAHWRGGILVARKYPFDFSPAQVATNYAAGTYYGRWTPDYARAA